MRFPPGKEGIPIPVIGPQRSDGPIKKCGWTRGGKDGTSLLGNAGKRGSKHTRPVGIASTDNERVLKVYEPGVTAPDGVGDTSNIVAVTMDEGNAGKGGGNKRTAVCATDQSTAELHLSVVKRQVRMLQED